MHYCSVVFFNDTATTEIYTLSLHDALPILDQERALSVSGPRDERSEPATQPGPNPLHELRAGQAVGREAGRQEPRDRKSTRLNSSHANISYAVFFLKKKNELSDNSNTFISP